MSERRRPGGGRVAHSPRPPHRPPPTLMIAHTLGGADACTHAPVCVGDIARGCSSRTHTPRADRHGCAGLPWGRADRSVVAQCGALLASTDPSPKFPLVPRGGQAQWPRGRVGCVPWPGPGPGGERVGRERRQREETRAVAPLALAGAVPALPSSPSGVSPCRRGAPLRRRLRSGASAGAGGGSSTRGPPPRAQGAGEGREGVCEGCGLGGAVTRALSSREARVWLTRVHERVCKWRDVPGGANWGRGTDRTRVRRTLLVRRP